MIETVWGAGYSSVVPAEKYVLLKHKRTPTDGTAPGILCFHAHNADISVFMPGLPTDTDAGAHAAMLAQAGFIVLAIEAAGIAAWSKQAAMDRADDAYAFLTDPAGKIRARPGKISIMGHSMGGQTSLNWIKRNLNKVNGAWLWAPVTNLDWARTQFNWGPEIAAAYPSGSAGFNIHDEPESWRNIGIPLRLAHATDDAVIPSSHTDAFVAAVNDPLVTKRPVATGGHIGLFEQVPESETTAFFKAVSA